MSRLPFRQLLISLLPLGVAATLVTPASAATFTVTEAAWGPSSAAGSFAWAIEQANSTPGVDVISLQPVGGKINVDDALTVSATFIGRFTDPVRIEGNGITLEGNPSLLSSSGIVYTKDNPTKPVPQDIVLQ